MGTNFYVRRILPIIQRGVKHAQTFGSKLDGYLRRITPVLQHERLALPTIVLTNLVCHHPRPNADEIDRLKIDHIMAMNVTRPVQTERASLVVFAVMKKGTVHFCANYRKLNAVVSRSFYQLLCIKKFRDSLGDAYIFSNLDANSVYWQSEAQETDIAKTVSIIHYELGQFSRIQNRLRHPRQILLVVHNRLFPRNSNSLLVMALPSSYLPEHRANKPRIDDLF